MALNVRGGPAYRRDDRLGHKNREKEERKLHEDLSNVMVNNQIKKMKLGQQVNPHKSNAFGKDKNI